MDDGAGANFWEQWSKRRIGAAVATVAGTIVLGAIGSGLWERLGSPAFDQLSRSTISGVDLVVGTYKDSIYREAALGFHEHGANFLFGAVQMIPPLIYFATLTRHPHARKSKSATRSSTARRASIAGSLGYYLLLLLTLAALSAALVSVSRVSYTTRVVTYAERAQDQLAPHLTEQEEEELRAQFRSVDSARDYYAFYARVVQLLVKFGLPNPGQDPL